MNLIENENKWKQSRAEYEKLKQAKMRLKRALRAYNQSYKQLENAVIKHTSVSAESLRNIDEASSPDKLLEAFVKFRDTKIKHADALKEVNAAMQVLEDVEKAYIVSVCYNLLRDQGLNVHNLAVAFGIHDPTLHRWIAAAAQHRAEICEDDLAEI